MFEKKHDGFGSSNTIYEMKSVGTKKFTLKFNSMLRESRLHFGHYCLHMYPFEHPSSSSHPLKPLVDYNCTGHRTALVHILFSKVNFLKHDIWEKKGSVVVACKENPPVHTCSLDY